MRILPPKTEHPNQADGQRNLLQEKDQMHLNGLKGILLRGSTFICTKDYSFIQVSKFFIRNLLRGTSERTIIDLSSEDYEIDVAGPSRSELRRRRSRSRSLTPPPEFTEQERLRTQMAIRYAYNIQSLPVTFTPSIGEF